MADPHALDLSSLSPKDRSSIGSQYTEVIDKLKQYADNCLYLYDREKLFSTTRDHRRELHTLLKKAFVRTPKFAAALGLQIDRKGSGFEVHELRRALRVRPDGRHVPQVIVSLTQSEWIGETRDIPRHLFRGGTTLVLDLSVDGPRPESMIRYSIGKGITNKTRRARTAVFVQKNADDPLRALMFASGRPEPFAALHAFGEDL